MICLLTILIFQKPTPINSKEQLEKLIPNQLVAVQGLVIEEKLYSNSKTIILDNDLALTCDPFCPNLVNRTISIQGIYDDFYKKIKILELKEK